MGLRRGRTLGGDLQRATRNPRMALAYLRRWSLLSKYAGIPGPQVRQFRRELVSNRDFQGHLERQGPQTLGGFGRAAELYVMVRSLKPKIVVETGVASGISSAHILLGLSVNGAGTLHSIDLPNIDPGARLPEGRESGWIIPDGLRSRWELHLGDSRVLLPQVIDSLNAVDLFFHDGDHSYENMGFEFEQALRKLSPAGLIVSDDSDYNRAFDEFCAKHALPCHRVVHMGVTKRA